MRVFFALGVGVALLLSAGRSRAQEPEVPVDEGKGLPISSSERPLTLPELTMRIDASGGDYHIEIGGFFGDIDIGYLTIGAGFGILDDLEIDAVIVPLFFNPDSNDSTLLYGNPLLGATYRFVNVDPVEVGASLTFSIPVADDRFFGLSPGIPVRVHLGDVGRLDTGIYFSALIPVSDELNDGDVIGAWGGVSALPLPVVLGKPGLPIEFTFNPVEFFFLGFRSGFGIADLEHPKETFYVPLGFNIGGTVPLDERPLVDIGWFFDFPVLFLPALEAPEIAGIQLDVDRVREGIWQTGGFVSFYLPLGD
jgi:hypothetical protein